MADVPSMIVASPGQELPVVQKCLGGGLGYFDPSTGEIAIEADQPEVGKHIILLHEMMHLAAEKMKQAGVCKRQPSEAFIENMAGTLFPMLALSGLWVGVTPEEVIRFYEEGEGI